MPYAIGYFYIENLYFYQNKTLKIDKYLLLSDLFYCLTYLFVYRATSISYYKSFCLNL